MRVSKVKIANFRGVKNAEIFLPDHGVLVGDNNTGKSTVLEAIDLVLGPERLNWSSPIDEHDFYAGDYIGEPSADFEIQIEVVVTDLNIDQQTYFGNHLEFWDTEKKEMLEALPPEKTDSPEVVRALRVGFIGGYDPEEDRFFAKTVFLSPMNAGGEYDIFKTKDKRMCGFLLLRTLRTGSRALSLERGSLLDIILRLENKSLNMWEDVLGELRELDVAHGEELGISTILETVQESLRNYVSAEWSVSPHIRVSDLTRETLRKTLTMFIGTGAVNAKGVEYAAPFNHQGTGTVNTLVLALLSIIAELKQNVIFAMEEPEIAIPPHAQRRVVEGIRAKSAQALFTSHSPYVLDEFPPEQIVLLRRLDGALTSNLGTLPPAVKSKAYRAELRTRFCECLLARRVLIVEGQTEYDAIPIAARRLASLDSANFKTLESLGIAVINAQTETQVAPLAEYFKAQGKEVFACCDKQDEESRAAIGMHSDLVFESEEAGFEQLTVDQTDDTALWNYACSVVQEGRWPDHLKDDAPAKGQSWKEFRDGLKKFLKKKKGEGEIGRLFEGLQVAEFPEAVREMISQINEAVESNSCSKGENNDSE